MRIHKNFYIAVSFLAVSFLCMLFLTTASPLYSVNPSPDGNTMFTVGKGLLHGLMPYKDLFDQRGPLIYLMNSVAALISYKSFLGIYIFESIAMFLDLFFVFKTLLIKYDAKISTVGTLTIIPLLFNSKLLLYGNEPEEYIIPLIFITIYKITKENPLNWKRKDYVFQGTFLAFAFWIKYTQTFTWITLFIILLITCLYKREIKKLFKVIFYGIIGFLMLTIPILAIYLFNQSLVSLFYVYFYLNFTTYVPSHSFISVLFLELVLFGLFYLIVYIKMFHIDTISRIFLIANFTSGLFIFNITCGIVSYYLNILQFICIIFPILVCYLLNKFNCSWISSLTICIVCLSLSLITNKNFFHYCNNKLPQKNFSTIINKSSVKTLLNYGTLDSGFYTYSGLLPHDKYFVRNNMNYKRMFMKQDEYVKSNKYNFIIIRYLNFPLNTENVSIPYDVQKYISQKYKMVGTRNVLFEGKNEKYVLYERKD